MRVALYARVSTRDKGQDTENQLAELRSFVGRNENWQLTREYKDEMTGSRGDRPQFVAMMEAASRREFDLVLFWSLDRFSREGVLETLQHLQRLTGAGVDWWSYREEYLRSIGVFRDAVLAILATIAKQERIRMSERVKAGIERARAAGKKIGGPRFKVFDRSKVIAMRRAGASYRDIEEEVGISRQTVLRLLAAAGLVKQRGSHDPQVN